MSQVLTEYVECSFVLVPANLRTLCCEKLEYRGTPVRQVVQLLERFQELLAAECFAGEGVDHFFDFGRDHVAADEVGIVEDRVEQPDR